MRGISHSEFIPFHTYCLLEKLVLAVVVLRMTYVGWLFKRRPTRVSQKTEIPRAERKLIPPWSESRRKRFPGLHVHRK